MISELLVSNFQAHEKLRIKLDPHINVICGRSDVGKSAIIRALRWASLNKPNGDGFIRNGTDAAKVTIVADDHIVKRQRGKGNTYHLDGRKLVAFKSDPPPEVTNILNLAEINFAGQHDPPFWFHLSPGEVSRQLNTIINLSAIDSTLGYLAGKVRENAIRVSVAAERVAAAGRERDRLADAPDITARWDGVEAAGAALTEIQASATLAKDLVEKARIHAKAAKNAAALRTGAEKTIAAGECWAKIAGERKELQKLAGDVVKYRNLADRPVPDLSGVEAAAGIWARVRKEATELFEMRIAADIAIRAVRSKTQIAADLEKQFKGRMGSICPLCNQPIKKS